MTHSPEKRDRPVIAEEWVETGTAMVRSIPAEPRHLDSDRAEQAGDTIVELMPSPEFIQLWGKRLYDHRGPDLPPDSAVSSSDSSALQG